MGSCCVKSDNGNPYNEGPSSKSPPAKLRSELINVEDFIIKKVIGRGTFGKVFMVRKKGTNKNYAMKVLKKEEISEKQQEVHTRAEREILEKIENPFIVKLHYAFQTPDKLYFVLDFVNGGELFSHLRREKKFSNERAKFYAAELVLALDCLHHSKIIYRDLKPENILLDSEGHVKITDFGLSKKGTRKTYTFCGTPEYLAPEVIKGEGHDKAVDWWSLGTLLYEMLCGRPPFWDKNRKEMFRQIVEKRPVMKKEFNKEARDLLKKLLNPVPYERLGNGPKGSDEIKLHPYFKDIDWEKLYNKELTPPYVPEVNDSEDTGQIDKLFTDERPEETPVDSALRDKDKAKNYYGGFTYKANHLGKSRDTMSTKA